MISEITGKSCPYKCADCGVPCDDTWAHVSRDVTPTDRGDWVQESVLYYCAECFHNLFPEEVSDGN